MATPYSPFRGRAPAVVQGKDVESHLAPAQTYNNFSSQDHTDRKSDPPRSCRDVFWGMLFYAHIGAIVYAVAVNAPTMVSGYAASINNDGSTNSTNAYANRLLESYPSRFLQNNQTASGSELASIAPETFLVILCSCGVIAFVMSTLALGFMMTFAEGLIKMALWFNILLFGVLAILSLVAGAIGPGLIFLVMCAFSACYAYRVWIRIPFAAANLVTAVTAVRQNLGLAVYAYWSLILILLWTILWTISLGATVYVLGNCDASTGVCASSVNGGIIFAFLVSYYWTAQVLSNVVHVTTAGTVGTWWFRPSEAGGCCSHAVRQSYVRALTTSFGSICLGSLIVAIIQAIRETINISRENGDSFIACCAECLIGCIESLVE
jgi:Plasma-membrane choline transporter